MSHRRRLLFEAFLFSWRHERPGFKPRQHLLVPPEVLAELRADIGLLFLGHSSSVRSPYASLRRPPPLASVPDIPLHGKPNSKPSQWVDAAGVRLYTNPMARLLLLQARYADALPLDLMKRERTASPSNSR